MKKLIMTGVSTLALTTVAWAGSVWNDCAAWYVGADDKNGNGQFETGELFDIRHAGNPDSFTHGAKRALERDNIQILTEDVECATLGRTLTNQKVLYFDGSLSTTNEEGKIYVNGNYIILPDVITGEVYTAILRFKVDEHHPWDSSYQYIMDFGADFSNKKGAELALPNTPGDNTLRLTYGQNTFQTFSDNVSITNSIYKTRSSTWNEVVLMAYRSATESDRFQYRVGVIQPQCAAASGNSDAKIKWGEITRILYPGSKLVDNTPVKGGLRIGAESGDKTMYRGRIHMVAFWNRKLSDGEITEAFGIPNPGLFQVGLRDEEKVLGGSSTIEDVTVSPLPEHWREVPANLVKGQKLNIQFEVQEFQTNLNQVLQFAPFSGTGKINVSIDGRVFASDLSVKAGKTALVSIRGRYLQTAGAHTCTIVRSDSGGNDLVPGYIALSGSWQIGVNDRSASEMNSASGSIADFYLADGNWMHMRRIIKQDTYPLTLHFNVPAELAGLGAKLIWATTQTSGGANNTARLSLNGTVLSDFPSVIEDNVIKEYVFPAGSFRAGENTLLWENPTGGSSGYYGFDFIRFQQNPIPHGLMVIVR